MAAVRPARSVGACRGRPLAAPGVPATHARRRHGDNMKSICWPRRCMHADPPRASVARQPWRDRWPRRVSAPCAARRAAHGQWHAARDARRVAHGAPHAARGEWRTACGEWCAARGARRAAAHWAWCLGGRRHVHCLVAAHPTWDLFFSRRLPRKSQQHHLCGGVGACGQISAAGGTDASAATTHTPHRCTAKGISAGLNRLACRVDCS